MLPAPPHQPPKTMLLDDLLCLSNSFFRFDELEDEKKKDGLLQVGGKVYAPWPFLNKDPENEESE
jgi:hypothetical protein